MVGTGRKSGPKTARKKKYNIYFSEEEYARIVEKARSTGKSISELGRIAILSVCMADNVQNQNHESNEIAVQDTDNKKNKKTIHMNFFASENEAAIIIKNSEKSCVSISEYIRRVCLGYRLTSKVDDMAIEKLAKIYGELGKIGGLIKQAFSRDRIDRKEQHDTQAKLEAMKDWIWQTIQWIRGRSKK